MASRSETVEALSELMDAVMGLNHRRYAAWVGINTETGKIGVFISRRENGEIVADRMSQPIRPEIIEEMAKVVREIDATWEQQTLPLGGTERR